MRFLEQMAKSLGPAGSKLALAKLRPKMEPILTKQGLTWEDVLPALELVDSVEELMAAAEGPMGFLEQMAKSLGPAGAKLALAKLRPKMEPILTKQGLTWEDVLPALESVDSAEELVAAAEDPMRFLEQMAKSLGPAGAKLALAKLRPKMEPIL